jgi:DNA repair exonuclease SbcCD ATPase subunit
MNVKLMNAHLVNFAGARDVEVLFDGKDFYINGRNGTGKTTIYNAIWWLFFGKNGNGEERFAIRPLDVEGNPIHNIDISVTATVMVNSELVELKKTSREKWVKKRGTETAQFQGNEIIYEIDGYPRKESEYKKYISDIVSEEVFKMLTSPTYFASMPWKKQRDILMQFVSEKSDVDLAKEIGGYDPILDDLRTAPSLDAIEKKYKAASKELTDKQKEIPVRIDELEGQIVDDNSEELLQRKKKLEGDLAAIDNARVEQGAVRFNAMNEVLARNSEINKELVGIDDMIRKSFKAVSDAEAQLERLRGLIESNKNTINEAKIAIESYKAAKFDEAVYKADTVCPCCGREYPAEKVSEIIKSQRDKFEKNKADSITIMTKKIDDSEADIKSLEADIHDYEALVKTNTIKGAELTEKANSLRSERDALACAKIPADAQEKIDELDAVITSYGPVEAISGEIKVINDKLAVIGRNTDLRGRVEALRVELKNVAQKIADIERMLYLLGMFIQAKMELVSRTVNEHFEKVSFKLFEVQINGGIKETCEMTVNGVPYSDLNQSDRILAGLRVIKALQNLFGVAAFIFIDNAESINADRIPKMVNQTILMNVTEDRNLTMGAW